MCFVCTNPTDWTRHGRTPTCCLLLVCDRCLLGGVEIALPEGVDSEAGIDLLSEFLSIAIATTGVRDCFSTSFDCHYPTGNHHPPPPPQGGPSRPSPGLHSRHWAASTEAIQVGLPRMCCDSVMRMFSRAPTLTATRCGGFT